MPDPKSGQENPIESPEDPLEADEANPGKNAEILEKKKEAEEKKKKKEESENEPPPITWFEFQLLDTAGNKVKGEKCTLVLEDGNKILENKKTDGDGKIRVEDIKPGKAFVRLVDRYDHEWVLVEHKE